MIETIYLTRHAESESNRTGNPGLRNPVLSDNGIKFVENKRAEILSAIGTEMVGAILCSPLKRALQTALLTYEDCDKCPTIYVMSILTEHNLDPESEGDTIEGIMADPDLQKYRHIGRLNFKHFMYGNTNNGAWCDASFRRNRLQRINSFWEFIGNIGNIKTVHVFTHNGFMDRFIQKSIDNYSTWVVPFANGQPDGTWRKWRQLI